MTARHVFDPDQNTDEHGHLFGWISGWFVNWSIDGDGLGYNLERDYGDGFTPDDECVSTREAREAVDDWLNDALSGGAGLETVDRIRVSLL